MINIEDVIIEFFNLQGVVGIFRMYNDSEPGEFKGDETIQIPSIVSPLVISDYHAEALKKHLAQKQKNKQIRIEESGGYMAIGIYSVKQELP